MENRVQGIKILGMVNIITSITFLIIYALPFFLSVILGWVTDMKIRGPLHWFSLYILGRLGVAIEFVALFLLLVSGWGMLRNKVYVRKLAIIASTLIILGELISFLATIIDTFIIKAVILDLQNLLVFMLLVFLIYIIFQLVYLTDVNVKKNFNDDNIKINLTKPIIAVVLSFIAPVFVQSLMRLIP